MGIFKFFRGKEPSNDDVQSKIESADSDSLTKNTNESDENNKKSALSDSASSDSASSGTSSSPSANNSPKNRSKTVKEKVDPEIQTVLRSSERIALIAVVQTVNKIGDIGKYSHYDEIDGNTGVHYFDSAMKSYVGWKWSVTISLMDKDDSVSILECNLVKGPNSIEVKEWIPFKDRLKPSDITETDSLPYEKDDPRLEDFINRLKNADNETVNLAVERMRVLTPFGKSELAGRWYEGTHGPNTASTRIAKAECLTCGFYIPLSGDLGQIFGVCANGWSRDDGRVVSGNHGCGMHSETDVKTSKRWKSSEFVIDQVNTIDIEQGDDEFDSESQSDDILINDNESYDNNDDNHSITVEDNSQS